MDADETRIDDERAETCDKQLEHLPILDDSETDSSDKSLSIAAVQEFCIASKPDDDEEGEVCDSLNNDTASCLTGDPQRGDMMACISEAYYDDEDGIRQCRMCRYEHLKRCTLCFSPSSLYRCRIMAKLVEGPPPTFTENSLEELIYHLEKTHPVGWEVLRQYKLSVAKH